MTTTGDPEDASRIARDLVERRLAACVNIVDSVRSIYRWENRLHEDVEQLLVIKTTSERIEELEQHLKTVHPYELAEFVVVEPEKLSPQYREWLIASTAILE